MFSPTIAVSIPTVSPTGGQEPQPPQPAAESAPLLPSHPCSEGMWVKMQMTSKLGPAASCFSFSTARDRDCWAVLLRSWNFFHV